MVPQGATSGMGCCALLHKGRSWECCSEVRGVSACMHYRGWGNTHLPLQSAVGIREHLSVRVHDMQPGGPMDLSSAAPAVCGSHWCGLWDIWPLVTEKLDSFTVCYDGLLHSCNLSLVFGFAKDG